MTIERTLEEFKNQKDGNIVIGDNIFISEQNMVKIVDLIKNCKKNSDMLITPYLVNVNFSTVYELLYYDFSVDVYDDIDSDIKKYNVSNLLPDEITSTLSPGIVTNKDDYEFVIEQLNSYFVAIRKMKFSEVRDSDIRMKDALLCFQIF